jgi:membrane protein YqaA with SNARE-associated domain
LPWICFWICWTSCCIGALMHWCIGTMIMQNHQKQKCTWQWHDGFHALAFYNWLDSEMSICANIFSSFWFWFVSSATIN